MNFINVMCRVHKKCKFWWMKNVIYTGILVILVLLGCSSQNTSSSPMVPADSARVLPDQESWSSSIIITREGRKVAEVWAGHILYFKDRDETVLKDSIHVDFFDSEGKHNSVLTAREGRVDNATNNLEARGHVVVVSDSGIVLKTEVLRWDNKKQKIISDVPVIFTTATDTIQGDAFISDPDLKNYEIKNPRGYSRRYIPLKKAPPEEP